MKQLAPAVLALVLISLFGPTVLDAVARESAHRAEAVASRIDVSAIPVEAAGSATIEPSSAATTANWRSPALEFRGPRFVRGLRMEPETTSSVPLYCLLGEYQN